MNNKTKRSTAPLTRTFSLPALLGRVLLSMCSVLRDTSTFLTCPCFHAGSGCLCPHLLNLHENQTKRDPVHRCAPRVHPTGRTTALRPLLPDSLPLSACRLPSEPFTGEPRTDAPPQVEKAFSPRDLQVGHLCAQAAHSQGLTIDAGGLSAPLSVPLAQPLPGLVLTHQEARRCARAAWVTGSTQATVRSATRLRMQAGVCQPT